MYEDLKLQLLLTFELELLKNKKIQIINYEIEDDGDYVGRDIVHSPHPYGSQIDTEVLENIATDASKELLKRGNYKTIYKVVEGDSIGNSYSYFPVSFCTDLEAACDCLKSICSTLSDYAYNCDDFCIHQYLRQNLTVYALEYDKDDDTLVISEIF